MNFKRGVFVLYDNKITAFDVDYATKKELQIIDAPNGYIARYVFFSTMLWDMYDDGVEIIHQLIDDKNSISVAGKEEYLNVSLDNRLFFVDFDGEKKYVTAYMNNNNQTLITLYLREFLNNDIEVSYCKHCGEPFVSSGKSIYCRWWSNIIPFICNLEPSSF